MKNAIVRWALASLAVWFLAGDSSASRLAVRQYYARSWMYNPGTRYYYRHYYYLPTPTYTTYSYHYVIYYPAQPTYVYYYNPHAQAYWGRYEIDPNGKGVGYSLLAEKDRKKNLKDIPDSAFPKPSAMPKVPEAEDEVRIDPPPLADLPKDGPKDLPK